MSVGVELRVVQLCSDPFLESLRDEMLQPFRFVMDLIPWISKNFMQECLDQPVMPHNLQGALNSRICQSNPVMLFVDQ